MNAYATEDEAIEREIVPALGEYVGDFDIEAIADRVLEFDDAYDESENAYRLSKQGFRLAVEGDEFWAIVEECAK